MGDVDVIPLDRDSGRRHCDPLKQDWSIEKRVEELERRIENMEQEIRLLRFAKEKLSDNNDFSLPSSEQNNYL